MFSTCIFKSISKIGISTLGELTQAYEHEIDTNLNKAMKIILKDFPGTLINIAMCFNENINTNIADLE